VGPHLYNVGVGCETTLLRQHKTSGKDEPNLRELFDLFAEASPQARWLVEQGQWVGELKGAPMRCNLAGAQWGRPGLLLAGEAAGSTFAFTGEGIGKALETGMACAEALLHDASDTGILQAQHRAYEALLPRYALYRKAQQFNRWPWMIDLAIWKARRSPRIVRALSDVLHERRMPGTLMSWRGLRALLFY
jgi:flavin-dependent dehydrogenase